MPKKDRQALRTTPGFTGPFKGDPQPGTLFDKRTVEKSGDEIGPRGYSLNRSRQFQKVIDTPPPPRVQGISTGSFEDTRKRRAAAALNIPSVRVGASDFANPPDVGSGPYAPTAKSDWDRGATPQMGRAKSKMIDTLARSTVPPEHMENLDSITVEGKRPGIAGTYSGQGIVLNQTEGMEDEESANYATRSQVSDKQGQGQQRGPIDVNNEITLLHEIGHHASFQAAGGKRPYHSDDERAAEEGRADRYATLHFRQDPRNPSWQHRTDPREHTYGAYGVIPGHDTPWREQTKAIYEGQLGKENIAPPKTDYSPEAMDRRTMDERLDRPMLDQPHYDTKEYPLDEHDEPIPNPSPFSNTISNKQVRGWSSQPDSETVRRKVAYRFAAIKNQPRGNNQTQRQTALKARWGSQNRNLNGEQFT